MLAWERLDELRVCQEVSQLRASGYGSASSHPSKPKSLQCTLIFPLMGIPTSLAPLNLGVPGGSRRPLKLPESCCQKMTFWRRELK